jgi:hypothetical protein
MLPMADIHSSRDHSLARRPDLQHCYRKLQTALKSSSANSTETPSGEVVGIVRPAARGWGALALYLRNIMNA